MTDSDKFKIESGIPAPKDSGVGVKAKYPFAKLRVGESFVIPGVNAARAGMIYRYWKIKLGHQYTARTIEGGARVWRLK